MIGKFKLPDNGIPIEVGDTSCIYKDVYHPMEWYAGEPYRVRVETLVLDKTGTSIFLRIKDDRKRYRIPGGSVDSDSSYQKQAENETNEEALISVDNLSFSGVSYHEDMDPNYIAKGGDTPIPYAGSISYVYTATYRGRVDKFTIEEKDLDDDMAENGTFHPLNNPDVLGILRYHHVAALVTCKHINPPIMAQLQKKLEELTLEYQPKHMFETMNVSSSYGRDILYHGSPHDFDIFHPMSLDLGNAEQKPGWSTFCFRNYDMAKRFAIMRLIQKYMDGKTGSKYGCNWDLRTQKPYIHEDMFAEICNALDNVPFFVYSVDGTNLELGIGNDARFPEVTFREDNVIPDSKERLYLSASMIRSEVSTISESIPVYEKEMMDSIKDLNRGWLSCMINRNYSEDSAVAVLTKAVSDGKLKPGDDVVRYMEENNIELKDVSFIERITEGSFFNISSDFEKTIILGDSRALYTSEEKNGVPTDPSFFGEKCSMLPLDEDLPNGKIHYQGFLYEIGDGGSLFFMGKIQYIICDEVDHPYGIIRTYVVPIYRRKGLGDVLVNYLLRSIRMWNSIPCGAQMSNRFWKVDGIRKWVESFPVKEIVENEATTGILLKSEDIFIRDPLLESGFKSTIDPNFKSKGIYKLSQFRKVRITKSFIDQYKKSMKTLCHVDPNDTGYAWVDKDDSIVGLCVVDYGIQGKYNWITAIEVSKKYQGCGIGKQLLDVAVKTLKGDSLTVATNNEVALRMYQNYGFKISKASMDDVKAGRRKVYYMYLPSVLQEYVNSDRSAYFLSEEELSGKVLHPKIPENYMTRNGYEDNKIKRVCFTPSIDQCLMALSKNCKGMELNVYIPDGDYKFYKPTLKEVPDSIITGEFWSTSDVKVKKVGRILVLNSVDGQRYSYGDGKRAELAVWEWRWISQETVLQDSVVPVEERLLANEPDIYYNKEKFDSGEINLCFITGHSGSGKSTMAEKMSDGVKVEHWDLDDIIFNKMRFTMEQMKEYGELGYSFFNGPGKKYWYDKKDVEEGRVKEITGNYENLLMNDFVKYAKQFAKSHRKMKFVLEGVWLFEFVDPKEIEDCAVYIKGTSALKSSFRAEKRDSMNDGLSGGTKLGAVTKGMLTRRIPDLVPNEAKMRRYRKHFSSKMKLTEGNETNLSNLSAYYVVPVKKGFNPRNVSDWDEELYAKTIDSAIDQVFQRDRVCEDHSQFSVHVYTLGDECAAVYLGVITVYNHGFDKDKNRKFDWEWEEQEDISQAMIDYLKEEVQETSIVFEDIIDVSGDDSYGGEEVVSESYGEAELEPIFIVCTFTGTTFGKAIQKFQKCKFSHSGLAMDSKLDKIYTFNMRAKTGETKRFGKPVTYKEITGGADIETLSGYTNVSTGGASDVCVMCIFVDQKIKQTIQNTIDSIFAVADKTKYALSNIFNIVVNRSVDTKDNMKMICSQFVDRMLKLANIDITGKSSNLVSPNDFIQLPKKNGKVFVLFDDKHVNYDAKKVDRKVREIKKKHSYDELNISESIPVGEAVDILKHANETLIGPAPVEESASSKPTVIPKDIIEFNKRLNREFRYGTVVNGKVITNMDDFDFYNKYKTLSISEFEKYKVGVCWDYVHYEANWFKEHGYRYEAYYIQVEDNGGDHPSHTFLVFYLDGSNSAYYFDPLNIGDKIEEYSNLSELLDAAKKRHVAYWENIEGKGNIYPKTFIRRKFDPAPLSFERLDCVSYIKRATGGSVVFETNHIVMNGAIFGSGGFKEYAKCADLERARGIVEEGFNKNHMYFYHLVPRGSDISNGITSLWYQYRSGDMISFRKNSEKYRKRLCQSVYRGRQPESLTDDEILTGLNLFRKDDNGANKIYLFLYPPFKKLGPEMRAILDKKDIYRIDLNDPITKKYLSDINWGFEGSDSRNNSLSWEYYYQTSPSEYFSDYTESDTSKLLFSYMNHVAVIPTNGYIPKKCWKKVRIPESITDITEGIVPHKLEEGDQMEKLKFLESLLLLEAEGDDELPSLGEDDNTNNYSADAEASVEDNGEEEQTQEDTPDEEEGGEEGREEDPDLNANDYSADADTGDDEDTGTNSSDTQSFDSGSTDETENQNDNNRIKNYALLNDFENLYRLASEIGDTIDPIIMEKPIQNGVLTQVRENLSAIKSAILDFITMHFRPRDYPFNLYYYEVFVALLRKNAIILDKNKLLSKTEVQKKKTNRK